MSAPSNVIPRERIERSIHLVRGEKVILDPDLAELYGVDTSALNRAVKRNRSRFPKDFMFQLTPVETRSLRCQIGISNPGRGGRRFRPYVFTEQGVAMLSSVLHTDRAILVNVAIMRAFVQLRRVLSRNDDLGRRLAELERKFGTHDEQIQGIFEAIRQLMAAPEPPEPPRKEMGFHIKEDGVPYRIKRTLRKASGRQTSNGA
jgi:hypothetical protein